MIGTFLIKKLRVKRASKRIIKEVFIPTPKFKQCFHAKRLQIHGIHILDIKNLDWENFKCTTFNNFLPKN